MEQEQKSVKNDVKDNKLPWNLFPFVTVEEIVRVYQAGAVKYGPNRWQKLEDGYQRYKGAMMRHLVEYEKGNRVDPETGCLHLAQVAWNAIAMLYYDLMGKALFPTIFKRTKENKQSNGKEE